MAICWALMAQPRGVSLWRRLRLTPCHRAASIGPAPTGQPPGRSRPRRPYSPGRLNCRGWAASGPLQGAPGQWPASSPGTGWRPRRCPRLQAKVAEDLLDHRLFQDGRNDLQFASHWAGCAACAGGSGSCGTTSARSLALGASTPWFAQRGSAHFAKRSYAGTKRIRCSLGRGTSAASRCMNSSGNITRCVAPSRQAVLSLSTTCPAALVCTRSLARAGRVM